MSCNCHEEHSNLNTWGCGCNKMPEEPKRKGVVKFCDICDPCAEGVTNVKICAFVVPTLEEGRYYKNSFIFVQEDDSVYFISDDRSEIPFGSRPKFIDNFDPEDPAVSYKNCVVYDLVDQTAYVYGPDGTYMTIAMTATPFSSLTGTDGILVTADGGNYTVAADWNEVAKKSDLDDVTTLATNHTGQINDLDSRLDTAEDDIDDLEDEVSHVSDLVDDANELAVEAKENAAAAQQTANDAMSTANAKQDALTAGANITISSNVISATDTTYGKATTAQNGLMSNKDREALINTGLASLQTISVDATTATLSYSTDKSDADGSNYTTTLGTLIIPAATTTEAGMMSAADKDKLDSIVIDSALSLQSTNPVQNLVITTALDGKQDIYPVGAVYTSTDSNAPDFTGTWTAIGNQTIGTSTVYYYERTA